jgi:hypothetical protein
MAITAALVVVPTRIRRLTYDRRTAMRTWSLSTLFCILLLIATCSNADDFGAPTKSIPELEVLNHYLGTWGVTIGDGTTKAEANARWILLGRFLQRTTTLQPSDGAEKVELTTLITYVPEDQMYRSWMFSSNGVTAQGEATWDETKKVMTSVLRDSDSDNTTTITSNFAQADIETWNIVVTDRAGKTVLEVGGVNRHK